MYGIEILFVFFFFYEFIITLFQQWYTPGWRSFIYCINRYVHVQTMKECCRHTLAKRFCSILYSYGFRVQIQILLLLFKCIPNIRTRYVLRVHFTRNTHSEHLK